MTRVGPGWRTGRDRAGPGLFPPQQRHEVVALACSEPAAQGLPLCRWSIRTLRRAAIALGHVPGIAVETARRWMATADLKLHRCRHWLHSSDPRFDQRMADIVALYADALQGKLVYCIDERTIMQARERFRPDWPTRPGMMRKREFHYRRHGTLTLFGCCEVATGTVHGLCPPRHRTQEFLQFLNWLVPQLPVDRPLHFVLDNYATHKTQQVRQFLARHQGRSHFHFTPTHASWLNQIELWFSTLTRRVLQLGDFTSLQHLQRTVLDFLDYYNQHDAQPYRWTFTGQPRGV
ncbi:MAG: IS630 family transposase [Anaerolineae bacterium]|nr:IS630 family transposase [Anaerolineae bacterium]